MVIRAIDKGVIEARSATWLRVHWSARSRKLGN
jgi:hypothetical protein